MAIAEQTDTVRCPKCGVAPRLEDVCGCAGRRIEICDPDKPVMLIDENGERPHGPVDVMAHAAIVRVCPDCKRETARDKRLVCVRSAGEWYGTTVHCATTGEKVTEVFSVVIWDDAAGPAAVVLAHHIEYECGERHVRLCDACVPRRTV